jgi:hypothetical protein
VRIFERVGKNLRGEMEWSGERNADKKKGTEKMAPKINELEFRKISFLVKKIISRIFSLLSF